VKGCTKRFWAVMTILAVAAPAGADTQLNIGGQIRLREQLDKRSFDTSAVTSNFAEMRTRVSVEAVIDDNTHAFVQLQDSRIAGDTTFFGAPASGALNDGKNVDIHQAYVLVDNIFGEGWGGKGGRFEFAHGNERVFGPVGWSNVGRSWEGMMLWYDNPDFKATGFWLKSRELMDPSYNRDFDIFGLYGNVKAMENARFDLFGFYEYDADTNGYAPGINRLGRFNFGLYYYREYKQFDFELNGVYQLGKMPRGMLPDSVEIDISAFLAAFEVGYTFAGAGNARVAAGIDYASGDDGKDTTKFKAYNNLYYTGHKFRGYMDYFVSSDTAGLMDLMLRGKIDPTKGWTVKGDLHYFLTAQKYHVPPPLDTTKTANEVGIEVDLTVTTTRVAGVQLDAGASIFLPKETFAGMKNPDPGFWAWSMATVNFGK
jgi:hypothetical protein